MTTEQRLERLEREIRWMRRIGAVGVAVAAAVFLIGQGQEKVPPDLVVRSLAMKDGDGKIRANLTETSVGFLDKRGYRVGLSALADGSSVLSFNDKGGMARVGLVMFADGSPALRFRDKDGKTRALGVTETVNNRTGAETKTAENTLTMYDAKGNVIWQAPR